MLSVLLADFIQSTPFEFAAAAKLNHFSMCTSWAYTCSLGEH